MDKLLALIEVYYPKYFDDAVKYLAGYKYRGYNCYVLRKDIFHAMCSFQFDILFRLERELDTTFYSKTMGRTLGFMGEVLFGIFIYHLERQNKYNLRNLKIVFFKNSKAENELIPAYEQSNIPIVLMSSSNYVPYLGVFLKSLARNASVEYNYDVIVLHKEIVEVQETSLRKVIEEYPNISVRFYNPIAKVGNIKFHVASPVYSDVAYYRLLTPWILHHYNKAIVMDCDIVVKKDLSVLYSTDLDGRLVAGVRDVVYQGALNGVVRDALEYTYNTMEMKNPYDYINTGVLVMDLKQIRDKYFERDFISLAQTKKFRIQEQDMLNVVFEGQVQFLDIRWNYYVEMNEWVTRCISSAPAAQEDAYRAVIKGEEGPYLIHYANIPKPWDNPGVLLADEFWEVARETSFYEILLARLTDARVYDIRVATYDIQCRLGIWDARSGARKLADKLFPLGSRRRNLIKAMIPRDSLRWKICKQIYYVIRPQYRKAGIAEAIGG